MVIRIAPIQLGDKLKVFVSKGKCIEVNEKYALKDEYIAADFQTSGNAQNNPLDGFTSLEEALKDSKVLADILRIPLSRLKENSFGHRKSIIQKLQNTASYEKNKLFYWDTLFGISGEYTENKSDTRYHKYNCPLNATTNLTAPICGGKFRDILENTSFWSKLKEDEDQQIFYYGILGGVLIAAGVYGLISMIMEMIRCTQGPKAEISLITEMAAQEAAQNEEESAREIRNRQLEAARIAADDAFLDKAKQAFLFISNIRSVSEEEFDPSLPPSNEPEQKPKSSTSAKGSYQAEGGVPDKPSKAQCSEQEIQAWKGNVERWQASAESKYKGRMFYPIEPPPPYFASERDRRTIISKGEEVLFNTAAYNPVASLLPSYLYQLDETTSLLKQVEARLAGLTKRKLTDPVKQAATLKALPALTSLTLPKDYVSEAELLQLQQGCETKIADLKAVIANERKHSLQGVEEDDFQLDEVTIDEMIARHRLELLKLEQLLIVTTEELSSFLASREKGTQRHFYSKSEKAQRRKLESQKERIHLSMKELEIKIANLEQKKAKQKTDSAGFDADLMQAAFDAPFVDYAEEQFKKKIAQARAQEEAQAQAQAQAQPERPRQAQTSAPATRGEDTSQAAEIVFADQPDIPDDILQATAYLTEAKLVDAAVKKQHQISKLTKKRVELLAEANALEESVLGNEADIKILKKRSLANYKQDQSKVDEFITKNKGNPQLVGAMAKLLQLGILHDNTSEAQQDFNEEIERCKQSAIQIIRKAVQEKTQQQKESDPSNEAESEKLLSVSLTEEQWTKIVSKELKANALERVIQSKLELPANQLWERYKQRAIKRLTDAVEKLSKFNQELEADIRAIFLRNKAIIMQHGGLTSALKQNIERLKAEKAEKDHECVMNLHNSIAGMLKKQLSKIHQKIVDAAFAEQKAFFVKEKKTKIKIAPAEEQEEKNRLAAAEAQKISKLVLPALVQSVQERMPDAIKGILQAELESNLQGDNEDFISEYSEPVAKQQRTSLKQKLTNTILHLVESAQVGNVPGGEIEKISQDTSQILMALMNEEWLVEAEEKLLGVIQEHIPTPPTQMHPDTDNYRRWLEAQFLFEEEATQRRMNLTKAMGVAFQDIFKQRLQRGSKIETQRARNSWGDKPQSVLHLKAGLVPAAAHAMVEHSDSLETGELSKEQKDKYKLIEKAREAQHKAKLDMARDLIKKAKDQKIKVNDKKADDKKENDNQANTSNANTAKTKTDSKKDEISEEQVTEAKLILKSKLQKEDEFLADFAEKTVDRLRSEAKKSLRSSDKLLKTSAGQRELRALLKQPELMVIDEEELLTAASDKPIVQMDGNDVIVLKDGFNPQLTRHAVRELVTVNFGDISDEDAELYEREPLLKFS